MERWGGGISGVRRRKEKRITKIGEKIRKKSVKKSAKKNRKLRRELNITVSSSIIWSFNSRGDMKTVNDDSIQVQGYNVEKLSTKKTNQKLFWVKNGAHRGVLGLIER
jgi:hypothetical protein